MGDIWIILVSSVIAISCSWIGCILVLRRMAMLSDAISHAVLPGIVISYLLIETMDYGKFLIAAIITAIISTMLIEGLSRLAKYRRDVSMGIVYTLLFSIGIILLSKHTDLPIQSDHVIQGNLEIIPLERMLIIDGNLNLGPEPLWSAIGNLLLVSGFFLIGFRAIKLISFDEQYARVNGINTGAWNILFLIITSATVVISFSSVGAILVIGFIVIPPSCAMLLSGRFERVLLLSSLFAMIACILGVYLAKWLNVSIAGSICTTMGAIFTLVFILDAVKRIFTPKNDGIKA